MRLLTLSLLMAGAVGIAACGSEAPNTSDTGSSHVSLFDRPARAQDRLPADLRSLPDFRYLHSTRLALKAGGTALYVGRNGKNDVCLIKGGRSFGGGTCSNGVRQTGVTYLSTVNGGTINVAGVAVDGVTDATSGGKTTKVENNVFLLHDVADSGLLTIRFRDGTSRRIGLGAQSPSSVTQTVTAAG
jgi:hypothetical protein